MTENEIIKALECCSMPTSDCKNCPYYHIIVDNCFDDAKRDALDLIKRQKAEIERLEHLRAELSKENESLDVLVRSYADYVTKTRTEAIKEFAERLREHYAEYDDYDDIYAKHVRNDIDSIEEEMGVEG